MTSSDFERRREMAERFEQKEASQGAHGIVDNLCYGLTTVRQLLFKRIGEDVERHVGRDSMMMPVSLPASRRQVEWEIEVFQVAVASRLAEEKGYISDADWFANWLAELRLEQRAGEEASRLRIAEYRSMGVDQRRRTFSRALEGVFPQAMRAPLILFRLFPPSVDIVTARAFGDDETAWEVRHRQTSWLPAIPSCEECRGCLLDNGEVCPTCGNPVWNYTWLTASD